ncbi:hypothetical protein [Rodentibacter sp. Ppn85]|uniref:hypothetical protein n=1 Tax=Rodentibacter sp. Ppn85 TaxID=1908525 RepID=UPI000984EB64|nr:hypothetical protein [Rodentibacter sp. Ppn85]OOF64711.1 hypothetical protein BKL51_06905 [Rodentibacter sp. Ppn85]
MKPILYYAEQCPDTAPFVAELKRLDVDYEGVEVLSSIPNLKQWLRLRDRHSAFDNVKAQGYADFPALLLENDRVILDVNLLVERFKK